ncbi:MAG TPA: ornithine cyclodeaminase family protein [Beijerinckiaceae bacterium]|nr:ornithine cyclodeaminase family protein [Beijerinckiaceae bacterium]
MTLILSNSDVEDLLTMRECIESFETAYLELAEGRALTRTRSDCIVPTGRDGALYSLKSMDGVIPAYGVGAVRIDSDLVTWPKQGDNVRRVKVPAAANGRYVGLVLLFSTETGEPLAIMPDGVMQRMRVGATSGLGAKHLARRNAATVALLGSGWQAGAQLMAVCAIRNVEAIRCFSPTRANREAFAAEMQARIGVPIAPMASAEDTVRGADIVLCATNAIDNVFFARWVEPGMHLSAIKPAEIEAQAIRRAERVVIHTGDTKPIHVMAAGVTAPDASAGKGWASAEQVDLKQFPTLPELIAGRVPGRASEREVTCFVNNLGLGFQFAAAGALVLANAKKRGIGRELPTDWFTQDVHP